MFQHPLTNSNNHNNQNKKTKYKSVYFQHLLDKEQKTFKQPPKSSHIFNFHI
jgi:hypothetical protein